MGKNKEQPRYNILSMRISDEEMSVLTEMKQQTSKSTSMLLREAMRLYSSSQAFAANREMAA